MKLKDENKIELICSCCKKPFLKSKVYLSKDKDYFCKSCNLKRVSSQRTLEEKRLIGEKVSKALKNKSTEEKTKIVEKIKKTKKEKYGDENFNNLEKQKTTLLMKYGVENAAHMSDHKDKCKKTSMIHFGVEHPTQLKEVQEKRKQTCIEKYGVDNASKCEEIKEKCKQNLIKKYGSIDNFYEQRQEVINKAFIKNSGSIQNHYNKVSKKRRSTNKERYGEEVFFKTDSFKEKSKNTINEKYGVDNISQTCLRSHKPLFEFNNEHFDSLPELCFYIYHTDHKSKITRSPMRFFFTFENKKHAYWPDFEINGQFFEIKGDQFLKEDGTWQNPFNHSLDGLCEAKRQCAIEHNVTILYSKDYQQFIDYVKTTYGDNFIKSLRKPATLV